MADPKYIGKNVLNHTLELKKGNVSGSATSTGSFGKVEVDKVGVSDGFYHSSDADEETYIKFPTGDKIYATAGGVNFIYAWQKDADVNKLIFNENNTDTDRSWNWVAENVVAADQWTTDTVFAKYNFKVVEGHEGHYLNSWKKMMSANLDNVSGSFGMNRVLFGNRNASHMVYVGNESLDGLLKSQKAVLSSDAFADFSMDVKDIRQNFNVELVSLVKFYTGE